MGFNQLQDEGEIPDFSKSSKCGKLIHFSIIGALTEMLPCALPSLYLTISIIRKTSVSETIAKMHLPKDLVKSSENEMQMIVSNLNSATVMSQGGSIQRVSNLPAFDVFQLNTEYLTMSRDSHDFKSQYDIWKTRMRIALSSVMTEKAISHYLAKFDSAIRNHQ